jgi:hypothetical protein
MVRKTKISKTFCKMLIIVCIAAILYSLARSFLFSREGLDNHGLTDFVYDSSNATLPPRCNNSEDCLKQCEYSIIKENKNCFTGTAAESPLNLITNLTNYSNITTSSACGDKCRSTDKCEGFVWKDPAKYGKENNCQLRGGFYGHNPVSLINHCKDSGNAGWNTYLCKQPGGTVAEWQHCDISSICVSPYSFCRIGDKRCLSKSQCEWANSQNGTSRDCTPMPLPSLPTNFSGT